MTPRQVFDVARHEYRLNFTSPAQVRLVAAVGALTAVLGAPGELWTLEASPHAPTVAVLVYRGRRIGLLGSTVTGKVADSFLPGTAGRV